MAIAKTAQPVECRVQTPVCHVVAGCLTHWHKNPHQGRQLVSIELSFFSVVVFFASQLGSHLPRDNVERHLMFAKRHSCGKSSQNESDDNNLKQLVQSERPAGSATEKRRTEQPPVQ